MKFCIESGTYPFGGFNFQPTTIFMRNSMFSEHNEVSASSRLGRADYRFFFFCWILVRLDLVGDRRRSSNVQFNG